MCDTMPAPRDCAPAVVHGNLIYLVGGGTNTEHASTSVQCYNPVTRRWSTLAPMPTARRRCRAQVIAGCLFVFGGAGIDAQELKSLECYSFDDRTWTTLPSMTTKRGF
jgi:hypothetical protein